MNAKCMDHTFDGRGNYPLRKLARAFAYIGAAVVAYAAALVVLAVQMSIIEF